jgi:Short C-terminal domain
MALEFTSDEQAFRALVVHRLAEAMRPCLDEAVGQNIRERAAWLIVSSELVKLASIRDAARVDCEAVRWGRTRLLQRHCQPLKNGSRRLELAAEVAHGVIIALLVSIVFAAIIVWIADWTARPQTALDLLNQRLARGEIDRAEYDEKRRLLGR